MQLFHLPLDIMSMTQTMTQPCIPYKLAIEVSNTPRIAIAARAIVPTPPVLPRADDARARKRSRPHGESSVLNLNEPSPRFTPVHASKGATPVGCKIKHSADQGEYERLATEGDLPLNRPSRGRAPRPIGCGREQQPHHLTSPVSLPGIPDDTHLCAPTFVVSVAPMKSASFNPVVHRPAVAPPQSRPTMGITAPPKQKFIDLTGPARSSSDTAPIYSIPTLAARPAEEEDARFVPWPANRIRHTKSYAPGRSPFTRPADSVQKLCPRFGVSVCSAITCNRPCCQHCAYWKRRGNYLPTKLGRRAVDDRLLKLRFDEADWPYAEERRKLMVLQASYRLGMMLEKL